MLTLSSTWMATSQCESTFTHDAVSSHFMDGVDITEWQEVEDYVQAVEDEPLLGL